MNYSACEVVEMLSFDILPFTDKHLICYSCFIVIYHCNRVDFCTWLLPSFSIHCGFVASLPFKNQDKKKDAYLMCCLIQTVSPFYKTCKEKKPFFGCCNCSSIFFSFSFLCDQIWLWWVHWRPTIFANMTFLGFPEKKSFKNEDYLYIID